jgi:hypothetical protein
MSYDPQQYGERKNQEAAEAMAKVPAYISLHKRLRYGDSGYGEPFVETSVLQHDNEESARSVGGIVYKLV